MKEKVIDKILRKINKETSIVRWIRPLNLEEEKEKFFNRKDYNPHFIYRKFQYDFEKNERILRDLKFNKSPINILFKKKRDELLKRIALIKSIGKENFTKESIGLFGFPEKNIIELAKKNISSFKKNEYDEMVSHKEIKKEMNRAIRSYGILNWNIIAKKIMADCVCSNNWLYLKPNVKFTRVRLKKTIAHEIETHILRKKNGNNQPYYIFSYGTGDYLYTEEGLAVMNEELVSKEEDEKKYWPAAYSLAIYKALEKSFKDVYEYLRELNISKNKSWDITARVKRGLGDTSLPGGFTKDHLYFSGKYIIKEYIQKGGKLEDLYMGKIGIKDLEIIKQIEGIKKPKHIPHFYKKL